MGYKVFINDEETPLFETDSEHSAVDQVTVTNARGEVTTIGSPNYDEWLRIRINERPIGLETYLDTVEGKAQKERQEKFDRTELSEEDRKAYVKADPETGSPVEEEEEKPESPQTPTGPEAAPPDTGAGSPTVPPAEGISTTAGDSRLTSEFGSADVPESPLQF